MVQLNASMGLRSTRATARQREIGDSGTSSVREPESLRKTHLTPRRHPQPKLRTRCLGDSIPAAGTERYPDLLPGLAHWLNIHPDGALLAWVPADPWLALAGKRLQPTRRPRLENRRLKENSAGDGRALMNFGLYRIRGQFLGPTPARLGARCRPHGVKTDRPPFCPSAPFLQPRLQQPRLQQMRCREPLPGRQARPPGMRSLPVDILPSLARRPPLKRKGRGFLREPFWRPLRRVPAADGLLRRSPDRRSGQIPPTSSDPSHRSPVTV